MVLAVWGVYRAATDAEDDSTFTSFLMMGASMLPVAWSVLRPLWSEDASIAIMVSLVRTIIVPIVVAWPPAIAAAVAVSMPSVVHSIESTRRENGWRYFFGADDGSLIGQALGLGGLIGVLFGILLGLVLSVFVVLPALAWCKPIGAAKSNMLKTETKEDRAAATAGIRMLSIILMMTFGVPTLIIFGREEGTASSVLEAFANVPKFFVEPGYYYGDLMFVLGLLAIPFGILLMIRLKRVQRPDIERRAEYGVNSLDDHVKWKRQQREAEAAHGEPAGERASEGASEGGVEDQPAHDSGRAERRIDEQ